MRKIFFCFLIVGFISSAKAQNSLPDQEPSPTLPANPVETTDQPPQAPVKPTLVETTQSLHTQTLRGLSQFTASLHFSPFATWIPRKMGLSGGYIFNERWTLEGEYTQGSLSADFKSVDFGKIVDRRFGLQSRWYPGTNSFNFILGFYRSEFTAELGNTVLNHINGVPASDILKFESYGPQLGLSNRWQWHSGVTFGIDWFVMYVPLFGKKDDNVLKDISNSSDRSNLDTVVSVVQNIPQFDLLKLSLGYNF